MQNANVVEEVPHAPFNTWETPQQSQGFVGIVQESSSGLEKSKTEDRRRVRFDVPAEQKHKLEQERNPKEVAQDSETRLDRKDEKKNIVTVEERRKLVVFY